MRDLTAAEKFYIQHNYEKVTSEELIAGIGSDVSMISILEYINSIKNTNTNTDNDNKISKPNLDLTQHKSGVTVMTKAASEVSDEFKKKLSGKPVNTRTNIIHNPR